MRYQELSYRVASAGMVLYIVAQPSSDDFIRTWAALTSGGFHRPPHGIPRLAQRPILDEEVETHGAGFERLDRTPWPIASLASPASSS
jgi:hypothetical protein